MLASRDRRTEFRANAPYNVARHQTAGLTVVLVASIAGDQCVGDQDRNTTDLPGAESFLEERPGNRTESKVLDKTCPCARYDGT